jgi:hypothetical protein
MSEPPVEASCFDSDSDVTGTNKNAPYNFRQKRQLTEKAMIGIPGSRARCLSESEGCFPSDEEDNNIQKISTAKLPEHGAYGCTGVKTAFGQARGEPSSSKSLGQRDNSHKNEESVQSDIQSLRRDVNEMASVVKDALSSISHRFTELEFQPGSHQELRHAPQFANQRHGHRQDLQNTVSPVCNDIKVALHPPRFDGQSDWTAFKIQFESYANLARWSHTMRAQMLGQCLEKTARRFFTNLSDQERNSYEGLMQILSRRFGDAPTETYRSQLNSRTRKSGESIHDLRDDLWQLVCKAYPGMTYDAKESLTLQSLLNTVDVNTRIHLASRGITGLQEAVHVIENYKAIIGADKRNRKPNKTGLEVLALTEDRSTAFSNMDKTAPSRESKKTGKNFHQRMSQMEEAIAKLTKMITKSNTQKSSSQQNNTDSKYLKSMSQKPRACFRCGDPSHFIKDCPSPGKTASSENGQELDQA